MAYVHVFCFVFSLRLGAIIISTIALASSSIYLIFLLLNLEEITVFSKKLQKVFDTNELLQSIFQYLHLFEELNLYVIGLSIFYLLMIISCIILLIGAYHCKPNLIYQFLFFYIIYIFLSCFYLLIFYLSLVTEKDPLGTIIYFTIVFFLLIFWVYTWVCVYSLSQVINEVQRRLFEHLNNPVRYYVKKVTP